jgi:predicted dehydrogenase
VSDAARVGVIGAGAIAQVAHLNVLRKLDATVIAGICDIDVAKAQALASRFAVRDVYDDIEDLLRYGDLDAVVVCTPNHLHEVHVITAVTAGIPVLCERPLALTAGGVERVMAAREQATVPVMVGMNHRFRSDVQVVQSFLAGGELGTLRTIRAHWHIFRPVGPAAGWRERRAESGGGAMFDLGLPLVDLALWLASCPAGQRVTACFAPSGEGGVEDFASALIQCAAGHNVFIDVSWHHVGPLERFTVEVMGDEGSATVAPLGVYKEMHGTPVSVTPPEDAPAGDPFSASYRAEWEHFIGIVRDNTPPPDLADQLRLHRVMEAIRQSAEEGIEVTL